MSSRMKTLFLIAGGIVLLLLFFLLLRFLLHRTPVIPASPKTPVVREQIPKPKPSDLSTPPLLPLLTAQETALAEGDLQTLSTLFVERSGSFSSESNFANTKDLLPLMSAHYRQVTEQTMASAAPQTSYYAVTTRVLSVRMDMQDDTAGQAAATVSTQRQEAKGTIQNISVRYQMAKITFVKEGSVWRVDSLTWQTN